ncbi:MAG: nuclear transport factor 2 family protein [Rhodospirillaceae bacterium]|nr:nuclear transport factor 2 family protein [Rhodospirillaceae bacterium]
MSDANAVAEITALETARCRALVAEDMKALGAMIAEDLVHIHTTGRVETKAEYLAGAANRIQFLAASHRDTKVRVYGNIAVATGTLEQVVRTRATGDERRLLALATRVWRKDGGGWLLCSFHGCLAPAPQ